MYENINQEDFELDIEKMEKQNMHILSMEQLLLYQDV
jgi:hypothetical protein